MSAAPAFAALGGDHDNDSRQEGRADSADAIGGQVVAAHSSGQTSIDATNRSHDARIRSGDAVGSNENVRIAWVTGTHFDGPGIDDLSDIDDEDQDQDWDFSDFALSGDGIGGQVIGVTTARGAVTDAVLANTSEDVDVRSGDATALDDAFAETGAALAGQAAGIANSGVTSLDATNLSRDSDAESGEAFAFDDATALTGDGIAGELIGITTARTGRADVVIANTSQDVDALSGDADAFDDGFAETGNAIAGQVGAVNAGGLTSVDATNLSLDGSVRTGDAEATDTVSITGDGIAGQVFGVVSSPGGRADLVAANASTLFDLLTGDAFSQNVDIRIVGVFGILNIID